MKTVNRIITVMMSVVMMLSCIGSALAAPTEQLGYEIQSTVIYEEGCIVERVTDVVNGNKVNVEVRTYENNTKVVEIVENGKTTTFTYEADYQALLEELTASEKNVNAYALPDDALDYRYLVTKTYSEYYISEYKDYAEAFDKASEILEYFSDRASDIAKLASIICEASVAEKPTYVTKTVDYYEVFNSSGEYLGYYYMDYTVLTEVEGERATTISGGTTSMVIY